MFREKIQFSSTQISTNSESNAGGILSTIKMIPVEWVSEINTQQNDVVLPFSSIQLKQGKGWIPIEIATFSGKYGATNEDTPNGMKVLQELSFELPKQDLSKSRFLSMAMEPRWLALITDRNKYTWCVGTMECPLNLIAELQLGSNTGNKNNHTYLFLTETPKPAFIVTT